MLNRWGVPNRTRQSCQHACCWEGSTGCGAIREDGGSQSFTPDYKPIKVEVVNAMIQYDSHLDDKEYMLVIQNALRVPSMSNNLIPPFIMRENGDYGK